jgi:hypothetical protein
MRDGPGDPVPEEFITPAQYSVRILYIPDACVKRL